MRATALMIASLAALGCSPGHGLVTLTVTTTAGTSLAGLDAVAIKLTDRSHTPARAAQPFTVAVPGGAIPPSLSVALAFGGDVNGAVDIEADAQAGGATIASATTTVSVKPYQAGSAMLSFAGAPAVDMTPTDMTPIDLSRPTTPDLLDCTPKATDKFVISSVLEPSFRSDFALDLNGDGQLDNQYGNVLAALSSNGVPPASTDLNGAITAGAQLMLVTESSTDVAFANDPCAAATYAMARAEASPLFDGSGTFTVDTTVADGALSGTIGAGFTATAIADMGPIKYTSGFFDSAPPADAGASTVVSMVVPISFGAGTLVRVPLWGAHLQFEHESSGLVAGQLDGAIRAADVTALVIPAIASGYTAVAQHAPCDNSCIQLRSLFDTGGTADTFNCPRDMANATCLNPDGTCAIAGDHVISPCEISTSAIMRNILAPDVALFDANGNYKPDPANVTKNALSVGFGFVAARARY
jgi:hypothetical protein